jgi:hypothetical protein
VTVLRKRNGGVVRPPQPPQHVLDPEMREPTAAICSGFPLGSIGGIMAHARPFPPPIARRPR